MRVQHGDVDTLRISRSAHGAHLLGDQQLHAVPAGESQLGTTGVGLGDSIEDEVPVSPGDVLPGDAR